MDSTTFGGIFCVGLVFGFLLYYAVRHTPEFNINLLGVAIGAIGGATVIGFLSHETHWVGPYGLGLATGFFLYFVLALTFINLNVFGKIAGSGVMIASKSLVGIDPSDSSGGTSGMP